MAKRVVLAALGAAITMFFYGAFYWMVLPNVFQIGQPLNTVQQVAVTDAIKPYLKQSGVYWIPSPEEGVDDDSNPESPWIQRHKTGPIAHIYFRAEGADPMSGKTLIMGFLHTLSCTLFVAVLLALLRRSLCCFRARLAFVMGLGLFVGVWGELRQVIWMFHSLDYELFNACYDVSAWAVGGGLLAALVREKACTKP